VFERRRFLRQLEQFPLVAEIRRHDWDYGACRDWPSGDTGAAFREPVRSHIPTLLLAGEFDPVTPPQWAYLAAQGLSHSYTFTFPGIGHGVLDSDTCASHLVRAFLADPQDPAVPACVAFY
jgi:pimeloyl-ACP methyl ester carboxylesterase